jgi:hypothetical protein
VAMSSRGGARERRQLLKGPSFSRLPRLLSAPWGVQCHKTIAPTLMLTCLSFVCHSYRGSRVEPSPPSCESCSSVHRPVRRCRLWASSRHSPSVPSCRQHKSSSKRQWQTTKRERLYRPWQSQRDNNSNRNQSLSKHSHGRSSRSHSPSNCSGTMPTAPLEAPKYAHRLRHQHMQRVQLRGRVTRPLQPLPLPLRLLLPCVRLPLRPWWLLSPAYLLAPPLLHRHHNHRQLQIMLPPVTSVQSHRSPHCRLALAGAVEKDGTNCCMRGKR